MAGASTDSAAKNQRFHDELSLHFPLLSDPDGSAARELGILKDSGTAGRTTFLIGRDGVLLRLWEDVKIAGHVAEVLAAARAAAPAG